MCFDFCAQEQKLPLSLLPSGPGFTENPAQDLPFPDLVTAFARPCASDFSINLILVFAATKLFEKEPLPYPVNLLYDAKMPERKSIHCSFLNSKQLERVNAHLLGKLQNKYGLFTAWHLMQPL